jgi:GntR family transcriptional repressor for pyruvate dehydrogenase complex
LGKRRAEPKAVAASAAEGQSSMVCTHEPPPADFPDRRLVLAPGRRQSLGDQLYAQILDQLVSGRLQEGDRLPSETEMSEMFGVSRPIVRDALLRLKSDGLLYGKQGSGTYVLRRPVDRLKTFATADDIAGFLRFIEARIPIETTAAKLAARNRTESQLQRIVEAHEHIAYQFASDTITPKIDLEFHGAIAAATGNEFYVDLFEFIREKLTQFMMLSLKLTRTGSQERALTVIAEHKQILDAIRTQDSEVAEVAMHLHISSARRRLIDRQSDI